MHFELKKWLNSALLNFLISSYFYHLHYFESTCAKISSDMFNFYNKMTKKKPIFLLLTKPMKWSEIVTIKEKSVIWSQKPGKIE